MPRMTHRCRSLVLDRVVSRIKEGRLEGVHSESEEEEERSLQRLPSPVPAPTIALFRLPLEIRCRHRCHNSQCSSNSSSSSNRIRFLQERLLRGRLFRRVLLHLSLDRSRLVRWDFRFLHSRHNPVRATNRRCSRLEWEVEMWHSVWDSIPLHSAVDVPDVVQGTKSRLL